MEGLSKFVTKSFEQCIKSSDRVQQFLNTMTQHTRLPTKLLYIETVNPLSVDLIARDSNDNIQRSDNDNGSDNSKNENETGDRDTDDNSDTVDIDITDVSELNGLGSSQTELNLNGHDVQKSRLLSLMKNDNNNNSNNLDYSNIEEQQTNSENIGNHQNNSDNSSAVEMTIQEEVTDSNSKDIFNGIAHRNTAANGTNSGGASKTKNWLVSDSSKENHFEHCNLINVDGKDN